MSSSQIDARTGDGSSGDLRGLTAFSSDQRAGIEDLKRYFDVNREFYDQYLSVATASKSTSDTMASEAAKAGVACLVSLASKLGDYRLPGKADDESLIRFFAESPAETIFEKENRPTSSGAGWQSVITTDFKVQGLLQTLGRAYVVHRRVQNMGRYISEAEAPSLPAAKKKFVDYEEDLLSWSTSLPIACPVTIMSGHGEYLSDLKDSALMGQEIVQPITQQLSKACSARLRTAFDRANVLHGYNRLNANLKIVEQWLAWVALEGQATDALP